MQSLGRALDDVISVCNYSQNVFKLSNLIPLPCFIAFFRYITINHFPYIAFSFFPKMFFVLLLSFLSTNLFLHNYVMTDGEI